MDSHPGPVQEPHPPELAVLDVDAEPMYWQAPGQLLDLFGEMAERNLFLVQHLQVRRFAVAASVKSLSLARLWLRHLARCAPRQMSKSLCHESNDLRSNSYFVL
jgi:hypothetical protein